ncbi:allophanate hydrolase [Anaerosporobacter sp.]|uniref:allophanate hydrolase n=1 Tax=Anaerosporobacter sp. TaxID=1872529 RepID=UPI00286EFA08|nr:allophanate hydrolase [Anaerosporobacter sp.]
MKIRFPERISISWLKKQYENEGVTPNQVIDELLDRREKNKEYNIWITALDRETIKKYVDKLEYMDRSLPLWGIPFAIKDNIDLEGIETTAACPAYAYKAKENATVVERLLAAGAIPMGKTNLDQFATGLVGTRSPYGETHNSIKQELISGGSSSGSAVSVALGEVVFALGTDTAGSGRVPAALNNIVGYKSSIGAWSKYGLVPACASIDCITVFSSTMEDAYKIDDVVRGKDDNDEWSLDLKRPEARLPKKILLPDKQPKFYGVYKEAYEVAWEKTVKRVKELGITIEYVDCKIFSDSASILYDGPWVAERWADLREFVLAHSEDIFPVTKGILECACKEEYDAASVFTAMHKLQQYKSISEELMQDAILVMPTCGGTYTREEVRENPIMTNSNMGLYTNHCNLLNMAAIAIPSDFATPDVPFGITAFSLANAEDYLKGFAFAFEDTETMKIAVCGLHMKGFCLEHQLTELGARYNRISKTAPYYKMYMMNSNPKKPVLVKDNEGGELEVEIWDIPVNQFGKFIAKVPAPLALGKIQLEDGSEVIGFIGQMSQQLGEDITLYGGWRYVV